MKKVYTINVVTSNKTGLQPRMWLLAGNGYWPEVSMSLQNASVSSCSSLIEDNKTSGT